MFLYVYKTKTFFNYENIKRVKQVMYKLYSRGIYDKKIRTNLY